MSFASDASKLLTNKYFLYFMVFLAATNVLGYLVTNKLNAVIFFGLVSLLSYQFSKNMTVVLFISIIATNFMMSNKMMREGMDNATTSSGTTDSDNNNTPVVPALENVDAKDSEIAENLPIVKNAATMNDIKEKKQEVKTKLSTADINNPELNNETSEDAPEGFDVSNTNKSKNKNASSSSRLDYAATIEESYANLDSLLGSDSISKLTGDTQKLMKQQQNLFNTMNQMVPVLEGAQNMLKGFDMNGLTKSLGDISSLSGVPTVGVKK